MSLQTGAEALADGLPDLLVQADHLANTVMLGTHGRRRPGQGDDFWQYRPMVAGDSLRDVDWRRSARGDTSFVRQREWQLAQSVTLWVDPAASMRFASVKGGVTKAQRAQVLGLAAAILMLRAGERVGLADPMIPPGRSRAQKRLLAAALQTTAEGDYLTPDPDRLAVRSSALFLSDFLAPIDAIEDAVTRAADRGITGALVQVLDPAEETFPFRGRTIFQSTGGTLNHETRKATDLRGRYLDRLAARKEALARLAQRTGWLVTSHHTDQPALPGLVWIYGAMQRARA
ncbi:MAG: DUF58 domain-containing protein [Paracoccaceae bacterium]